MKHKLEMVGCGEAGRRLGVSATRVHQLAQENKLPFWQTVDGFVLFRESDIEKLRQRRIKEALKNRRIKVPLDFDDDDDEEE